MNRKKCCDCREEPAVMYNACEIDDGIYTGLTPLPSNPTVTMAYVPFQTDRKVYDAATALCNGTLFPVLNKPFTGGCCQ